MENSIRNPKPERRRFAIRNRDGVIVGAINITTKDNPEEAEIGYWQGAEFGGKGYMGRAVDTLTAFGFENLGYKLIFGEVYKKNEPSLKVLRRAGYQDVAQGSKEDYIRLEKTAS